MTDNEIIKALEYCRQQGITSECERCKIKSGCRATLIENALDLINRQKTKIERLSHKCDMAVAEREANVKGFTEEIEKAKSEAVREFIKKVKRKSVWDDIGDTKIVYEYEIDKLLLDNGIIVPPCKVGNTVYMIYWDDGIEPFIEEDKIIEVSTQKFWLKYCCFNYDDIGKTVFLTRDEAERALKEMTEQ